MAALPADSRMPHCQHCGSFVTTDFVRVFAGDGDRVHACPDCSANAGIADVHAERRAASA